MTVTRSLKADKTFTQDLSAGALSYTTTFARKFKLEQIAIHFSQSVSEAVTITLISAIGANYNTVLQSVTLVSEADFVYRPQGEANFQAGDEIKIQCTAANGVGTAYGIVKTSEVLNG